MESLSRSVDSFTHSGALLCDADSSMTASHFFPLSALRSVARSPASSSTSFPNMPGALRPRLKIVTVWPRCSA